GPLGSMNKFTDDEWNQLKQDFISGILENEQKDLVAKLTNSDPIMNQLDLLHKWLDRHRDMCEKWKSKEDILHKLNEQWNKD
uniref:Erythrocyte membrane protein 1 (PfEMP1) n=1 Tax=Plasmodium falciparum TaxID=5833 RepID=UPI00024A0886|nr:Chain A, Erythrocyte membrane protein 1 (PfEMP1) [Plasmodium falciparum]